MNELGIAKVSTEAALNICSLTIHSFSVRMILFIGGWMPCQKVRTLKKKKNKQLNIDFETLPGQSGPALSQSPSAVLCPLLHG